MSKPSMPEEVARMILAGATRDMLADYAFGDSEYSWLDATGKYVASGYRGSSGTSVMVSETEAFARTTFYGPSLLDLGKRGRFQRNDEGGDPWDLLP